MRTVNLITGNDAMKAHIVQNTRKNYILKWNNTQ